MRIAINGLGRIGKLLVRALVEDGIHAELALLNDKDGDLNLHAHLLEFDTVHGRWSADVIVSGSDNISLNGQAVTFTQLGKIEDLPLKKLGIDLVIDCTGAHKSPAALQPYFDAGVKKVVVSAPVMEGAANLVYGVNHEQDYDPTTQHLITAASCTTNCLAPVVKVVLENFGIKHGSITTIHDVTNTQTIIDRPHKDYRRARSALNSLIPTTTGSARAISLIYPQLEGKLNGHAVRVPLLNASLTDCVFELEQSTTAEAANAAFDLASRTSLAGILGYEERPLVSADYTNDKRSTIIDAPSTMVVNGTQLKVYAWYDNEMGYACRLADVTRFVLRKMP